ncbi:SRPBCC family protein [Pseudonocardia sp. GCM10023141]|uniref:SRPBCC family protein n=1 Tax=Pseudonocardia sp. GCM10023141 TaxID=3252653 RepID=UPI0036127D42
MRGEATIEITARPERIYALVSDLPRMGEFSPECRQVEWLDGVAGPVAGARFVGHNRSGPIRWSRRGTVRTAEPGVEFAFSTEEGGREGTLWRYRLAPSAHGTVVTESFEVHWIPWWMRVVDVLTRRHHQLDRAMGRTLQRLKAVAERAAA